MPSHHSGDFLEVRGSVWRLRSQTAYDACTELELEPAAPAGRGSPRVLLEPFDRPVPVRSGRPPRVVPRQAWMRAFAGAVAAEHRCDTLLAPAAAAVDLLAHQFVPALAMVTGGTPRILLADAVGLGKTIEAGLVLAELRARRALRRALVLTPAGLRDQWAAELRDRFDFDPVVADASWLRGQCLDLPSSINPWSVPVIVIASIDFIKRPEVRGGLDVLPWDLVVVDEAHTASADSERRAAAHAVAGRARRVLLLTATPHAGDAGQFDALCRIGAAAAGEPIAIIRRTRQDVGYGVRRRVHLLPVSQTPPERELHAQLIEYAGRIWRGRPRDAGSGARLAAIVLLKRACSSIASLADTLAFRLAHLGDPAGVLVDQPGLPFDDESEQADETPAVALAAPGLEDPAEERRVLEALLELARSAAAADSKIRAIVRWLRRVPEPCIVFTEYRDTLAAVEEALVPAVAVASLHGGLDRGARAEALRRFANGRARVLLATDAGAEGLNLQSGCRLVVSLELPWNPVRLEQRIGRVDRIGQQRVVHAVNLVAADTHEASVLSRLVQRLGRIRDALGSFDEVLGPAGERAVAHLLLGVPAAVPWSPFLDDTPAAAVPPAGTPVPAELVTQQLARARDLRRLCAAAQCRWSAGTATAKARAAAVLRSQPAVAVLPLVTTLSIRRIRRRFARASGVWPGCGVLAVYRSTIADSAGRLTDDTLVPLFVPVPVPRLRRARDASAFLEDWLAPRESALAEAAERCAAERLVTVRQLQQRQASAGSQRRRAIDAQAQGSRPPVQPGLFDQRVERAAGERRRRSLLNGDECLDFESANGPALTGSCALAFVLLVTS